MATAGPNLGGTATVTGTGKGWTNPNNVLANDGTPAASSGDLSGSPTTSQNLQVTGFGFPIPGGSTINGIQVDISRKRATASANGQAKDSSITLLIGGVSSGANKAQATAYPSSFTLTSYGGAADLWTLTPAVSDINGSGFGVQIVCQMTSIDTTTTPTADIDYVQITVTYTAGAVQASMTKFVSFYY